MDFEKKEFYGIVAKAKKQMQITIDQDCNVADTKPDIEKMIQTRGMVKIQETEMMIDRVRMKGEFLFQGLYGTKDVYKRQAKNRSWSSPDGRRLRKINSEIQEREKDRSAVTFKKRNESCPRGVKRTSYADWSRRISSLFL